MTHAPRIAQPPDMPSYAGDIASRYAVVRYIEVIERAAILEKDKRGVDVKKWGHGNTFILLFDST